jgi:hypothetical protein
MELKVNSNPAWSFGPLDSGRTDVNSEDFRGHKWDRAMIDLLQKY